MSHSKKFKLTPFMSYMIMRRPQLEATGLTFPGGWRDVSLTVNNEWMALDETERNKYAVYEEQSTSPPQTENVKAPPFLQSSSSADENEERTYVFPKKNFFDGRVCIRGGALGTGRGHKRDWVKPEIYFDINANDESAKGSYQQTQASRSASLSSFTSPGVLLPNPMFKQPRSKVKKAKVEYPTDFHIKTETKQQEKTGMTEFQPLKIQIATSSIGYVDIPPRKPSDWSIKNVQVGIREQDETFCKIREYFDSIPDEILLEMKFAYVHFNKYCPAPGQTYAPSEFCCTAWNLNSGILWFGGSPIDPGSDKLSDWGEVLEQSSRLSLPRPPYTYTRGLAYSVGEDRYEDIVKSIYEQSCTFQLSKESPKFPFHYVFASNDNFPIAAGCLAWLMTQCEANPRLRVLSMERFVAELLRTCQIRRFSVDFKAEVLRQMQATVEPEPLSLKSDEDDKTRRECDDIPLARSAVDFQKSTIRYVSSVEYASAVIHDFDVNSRLDNRLRLGCLWHQRVATAGSIYFCSTKLCKKWVYRTLRKALEILGRDFSIHAKELDKPDLKPLLWEESDAIGIEARQRLGFFGQLSDKRIQLLEAGFVFPNLLNEMKRRMPNGLTMPPARIIWPLERDIEKDLNWSINAQFFVHDSEPETRAMKLAQLKREQANNNRKVFMDDDW